MDDNRKVRKITEMADFNSAPGGYEVRFSLNTEDGSTVHLSCPQERLGQLIVGLMRAQELAGRERARGGGGNVMLAAPMQAVELAVGISPGEQSVLLQLRAQTGLVLDFAIPLELAEQLSDGIPHAIRLTQSGALAGPTH